MSAPGVPRSRPLGPAGAYRIVAIFSAAMLAVAGLPMLWPLLSPGVSLTLADKDFANYWVAARLVLSGGAADLFGPQPIYFAHLVQAFGPDYPWHNWSYPPHFLLLVWPLGFFGYKAAMLLFLAATGAGFALALSRFAGRAGWIPWLAAAPFAVHNLLTAQNGFLSSSLALGSLALREKRPMLAGALLGLLTVKPQLGLLFPFLLLAERRWRVLASATATAILLVLLSAAVFGNGAWTGYVGEVVPYQGMVMRELEGTFLAMLPSVYGMLRLLSLEAGPALAFHTAIAAPAALVAVAAFYRLPDGRDREIVLLVATFVVTPYALTYDLGLFAAALALLSMRPATGPRNGRDALLAAAMLLPLIMIPLGERGIPVAPAMVLAVLVLALREAWRLPFSTVAGARSGAAGARAARS